MKILRVDNHGRDYQTEHVVAENVQSDLECQVMLDALRQRMTSDYGEWWYISVADDYEPYVFDGF